jgi:hypothetical protein
MLSDTIRTRFPFPDPSTLRNGDMLIFGGYRGVGSYYALWLARNLVTHDQTFVTTYENQIQHTTPASRDGNNGNGSRREYNLSDYPLNENQWKRLGKFLKREDWYDHWPEAYHEITDCATLLNDIDTEEHGDLIELIIHTYGQQQKQNKKRKNRQQSYPTLVPRSLEHGPYNDGNHEVYLFIYPDEMGYFAPSAFSSLKNDYFPREYQSIILDPLLTHSCSYYGYILHEGTNHEHGEDLTNKLGNCDRFYAEGDEYHFEDIEEWVDIEQGNNLIGSLYLPDRNYFKETRELFSRHFEWLSSLSTTTNSSM